MFEALTDKFNGMFRSLTGRGRITEQNVRDAMGEVRTALLEADVNQKIVDDFCESVVQKAIGEQVVGSLQAGEQMVKIVHDELTALMGPVDSDIHFVSPGPTILMVAGLQGTGKTTTCGKLAHFLLRQNRRPLLVAADLQRPAAIDQLATLGEQLSVPVHLDKSATDPVKLCHGAIDVARRQDRDVVILDTAGRLHIEQELMDQLANIERTVHPHQIYLVCDAMTGQDAVNSAKEFNERLELDGVILTKLDGDARGGAALSVKAVTGKPIKFVGMGERLDRLEQFHPDRMAGRILGMGDVVSLVEKAQQEVDQEQAAKLQEKMAKGRFTLDDFLDQFRQVQKMGPMKDLMKMIPGMGAQTADMDVDEGEIGRMEAIICSMTKKERETPSIIAASRRRRIATGSGTEVKDVSGLLKSFDMAAGMMKQMAGMGMVGRMRFAKQMAQGDALSGNMRFKVKQRSKRLSKAEKDKRRKERRRRRR